MRLLPLAAPCLILMACSAASAADKPSHDFEKDILPLFKTHCLKCHGADTQQAALDLRTRGTTLRGGETGPAISPGSPENSLLWIKVAADKMPPGKTKLTTAEKELIRAWLENGAKSSAAATVVENTGDKQVTNADRQFWAFKKPVRPAVPVVKAKDRVRNPIDSFLLAALEKKGLSYSPEGERVALLRRATFDLTGLPPTPDEIDAFLADKSADAYEKVIDRLLASPRYGERWGRHWLDVAGYADSEGILDADYVRTAAWRYRDYVIKAVNSDKPYDRFLKEQIAGDELVDYWTAYRTQKELPPEVVEGITATGYLRCASDTSRPDFVTIKNAPGYYYQTLDDTVRIVASSTMGLTLHCAKCHSHKYDPLPQTEYYRIQAIFMSAYRPSQWVPQVQRKLSEATEAQEKDAKEHNVTVDAAVNKLKRESADLTKEYGDRLIQDRLAKLPEAIREDVRVAVTTDQAKRTEVQKYLAGKFQAELKPAGPALTKALAETYPEFKTRSAQIDAAIRAEEAKRRTFHEIRAVYDLPGSVETPLLRRGDYRNPGPAVTPGVLSVLESPKPFAWKAPPADAKTSGRRLAFAEWLTQPDHPLTARVMVNRLWLHHFGEGIVATPENFGRKGAAPSHPELLDWLATEFVAKGWSVKAMHKLIMTSSAYRQSSVGADARAKELDPDNHLLWRQRLRRLEAEALRDAVLHVAGNLNAEMYGPPVPMQRQADGEVTTPADASGLRRSVYLQVRRSQPLTMLQVFDQPVMETNCTRRAASTVSSQALTLLNSDFMVKQADVFAGRVLKEKPNAPAAQAIRLAFGRNATERERTKLGAFLDAQAERYAKTMKPDEARRRALADLCQMLLSANEFAYLE
jgi:hypothetical protein